MTRRFLHPPTLRDALSSGQDCIVRLCDCLLRHAYKWAGRFRQLDTKSEGLEVAVAICTGWMAIYFARCPDEQTGSQMADQMLSLAPRVAWVWGLMFVSLLGVLSFLEDSTLGRRVSAFLSFVFWFGTGAWMAPRYPSFYTPGLHMLAGFFASWVWTRIGELDVKQRYRNRFQIAQTGMRQVPIRQTQATLLRRHSGD